MDLLNKPLLLLLLLFRLKVFFPKYFSPQVTEDFIFLKYKLNHNIASFWFR